jgi:hypothetical protein
MGGIVIELQREALDEKISIESLIRKAYLVAKKLKLKERPLIVMEGSFVTYQPNINPKDMEEKINYLINKVKKSLGNPLSPGCPGGRLISTLHSL